MSELELNGIFHPEQDAFLEDPAMPPRGKAIKALVCSHGQAGEAMSVTAQNGELCPMRGPECLSCLSVHLSIFSDILNVGVFLRQSQRSGVQPSESSLKSLGYTGRLPMPSFASAAAGGPHLLRSGSMYNVHQEEETISIIFNKRFFPAILSQRARNCSFVLPSSLEETCSPRKG